MMDIFVFPVVELSMYQKLVYLLTVRWMYRYNAVLLRERFDQNKGVTDMRIAKKLLEDGEQELWDKHHPQRIRFATDPGGTAYDRGPRWADNVSISSGINSYCSSGTLVVSLFVSCAFSSIVHLV